MGSQLRLLAGLLEAAVTPMSSNSLTGEVQAALDRLDGLELDEHPEVFERLDAAILAELRSLDRL